MFLGHNTQEEGASETFGDLLRTPWSSRWVWVSVVCEGITEAKEERNTEDVQKEQSPDSPSPTLQRQTYSDWIQKSAWLECKMAPWQDN